MQMILIGYWPTSASIGGIEIYHKFILYWDGTIDSEGNYIFKVAEGGPETWDINPINVMHAEAEYQKKVNVVKRFLDV